MGDRFIVKITNNINLNNYINNTNNNNYISNNIKKNNSVNKSNLSRLNYSNNTRNIIVDNWNIFNPKLMKIKIVKSRIRKDKTGKPYLEYWYT